MTENREQSYELISSFTSADLDLPSRTNRITAILDAKKVKYTIIDIAANEKMKRKVKFSNKPLKLPILARDDEILGDYDEIIDANEYGEMDELLNKE